MPQGVYGPSKAALLAVARDLANDLGPDGIRVNTVVPSWMWGPNVQMYCQWQASERGVEPEDIKNELASANASSDGGRYRRRRIGDVLPLRSQLDDHRTAPVGERRRVLRHVTVPALPAASLVVIDDRPDLHVLLGRRRPGAFVGDMIVYPVAP